MGDGEGGGGGGRSTWGLSWLGLARYRMEQAGLGRGECVFEAAGLVSCFVGMKHRICASRCASSLL